MKAHSWAWFYFLPDLLNTVFWLSLLPNSKCSFPLIHRSFDLLAHRRLIPRFPDLWFASDALTNLSSLIWDLCTSLHGVGLFLILHWTGWPHCHSCPDIVNTTLYIIWWPAFSSKMIQNFNCHLKLFERINFKECIISYRRLNCS